mgnify:FL=1
MAEIFKFIDTDCSDSCIDEGFEILDEDTLAQYVAYLVMGYSRHVNKIIMNLGNVDLPTLEKEHKAKIVSFLTLGEKTSDVKRYKRDGWLFQMISWLVVNLKNKDKKIKQQHPHNQPAMHGVDGLAVIVNNGHIEKIILTEDKCTEYPKATIQNKVFPEFKDYEEGGKNTTLLNDVGTILDMFGDDYENAHNEITNKDIRQYRIGITREAEHNSNEGRKELFNGYETIVKGEINRRSGSSIYLANLRDWMDRFAAKVVDKINLM